MTLRRTFILFPSAALVCGLAAAGEQDDVAGLVIRNKARMAGETIYIDMFGRPARAQFKGASEGGLTVSMMGQEMTLPWEQVGARRLGGIALKAAETLDDHALVARFYHASGLDEEARTVLDMLVRLFQDRMEDVEKVRRSIFPEPEKPKETPEPKEERRASTPATRPTGSSPLVPNPASAWETVGVGGGGSQYYPSISPHNAKLAFVCCDMGGFYRTADGGKSWRMLDQGMIRRPWCFTVFHPLDPNLMFSGGRNAITMSADGGLTWQSVGGSTPSCIAFDHDNPNVMYAGVGRRFSPFEGMGHGGHSARLLRSTNGGKGWGDVSLKGVPGDAFVFYVHVDTSSPPQNRTIFIGTIKGIFRSDDNGQTWEKKTSGLDNDNIIDMVAYSSARNRECVLYCTVPTRNDGGKMAGGVYKSVDKGETWQQKVNGLNVTIGRRSRWGAGDIPAYGPLGISQATPDVVYVSARGTDIKPPYASGIYRTSDGGENWQFRLSLDRRWSPQPFDNGWIAPNRSSNMSPYHIGVNPRNPRDLIITGSGRSLRSYDGGDSWQQIYTKKYEGKYTSWGSIGLEVTTTYWYDVDPYDKRRQYITYTDIGFFRSEDAGRSWIHVLHDELPWRNTCYDIAIDPHNSKVIYFAMANFHDLPEEKMLVTNPGSSPHCVGGVYISRDFGQTIEVYDTQNGLPDRPGTAIVVDPFSPPESRTLYACFYDAGVYKSTDGGKHWTKKNGGLGGNLNCWRLDMAPDGTLYLGITRRMHGGDAKGALYKSSDDAETWTKVRDFGWLHDVRLLPGAPETSREVGELLVKRRKGEPIPYNLLVANYSHGGDAGGIFVSQDAGASFKTIYGGNVWSVSIFNDKPNVLYAGTQGGLYLSTNGGGQWTEVTGIPFKNLRRVTFDPFDDGKIYVTSFGGGVWHGPAAGLGR